MTTWIDPNPQCTHQWKDLCGPPGGALTQSCTICSRVRSEDVSGCTHSKWVVARQKSTQSIHPSRVRREREGYLEGSDDGFVDQILCRRCRIRLYPQPMPPQPKEEPKPKLEKYSVMINGGPRCEIEAPSPKDAAIQYLEGDHFCLGPNRRMFEEHVLVKQDIFDSGHVYSWDVGVRRGRDGQLYAEVPCRNRDQA